MPIINRIAEFRDDMTAWRRDIHAHPETAFEEVRTSDVVAKRLAEFGIKVDRGLAGTGVVGTLKGARGDGPAIGLRADLDALHIHEKNTFDHKSTIDGKMHACGHDGHTTMLLGAARYLAETRNFAGTVHFIFQPAEENEGGARVMVEEGLFDKFPNLKIITHHLGGLVPYTEGRILEGFNKLAKTEKGKSLLDRLEKHPHDYFRMFYADTATNGSLAALECGVAFFGVDRVLFATDMPFDSEGGPKFVRVTLSTISQLKASSEEKNKIYQENAKSLFKL